MNAATAGTRLVSEDGRYAVAQVQFDENAQSVPSADRALIPERGDAALEAAGVTAALQRRDHPGDLARSVPARSSASASPLLVLVIVLGSLVAAGLPLLVALLGVGVGLAGAIALHGRSSTSTR